MPTPAIQFCSLGWTGNRMPHGRLSRHFVFSSPRAPFSLAPHAAKPSQPRHFEFRDSSVLRMASCRRPNRKTSPTGLPSPQLSFRNTARKAGSPMPRLSAQKSPTVRFCGWDSLPPREAAERGHAAPESQTFVLQRRAGLGATGTRLSCSARTFVLQPLGEQAADPPGLRSPQFVLADGTRPNIGNLTTEPSFCIVREFASCVFYSRATTSGSLRRPAGGRPRGSGGSTPFRAWASPKQVPSQIAVSCF